MVVAEVLHRSPDARVLMLSALLENPGQLAEWLHTATGHVAITVDSLWRPTRTLRAIAGLAAEPIPALQAEARAFLAARPQRRGQKVDVPIRLLAALHGAWSGDEPADYAVAETGLTTKLRIKRNGALDRTDHTAPTTRVLVQALAEHEQRVLAFLPGDRHAPFAHARAITGLPADRRTEAGRPDVDALMMLADAEIGGPGRATEGLSELHSALAKGVAIHSSAMLTHEQRASEIAFERGLAVVMFATGTLAQGLNLPATAVVVGGTTVGDRRFSNTPEGRARTRAQLLNAMGRAGRAQIAARSISIVVPDAPLQISAQPAILTAKAVAPFLESEDAAVDVASRLDGLIERSLDGTLDMSTMAVAEQTAFAFLSYTGEAGDAAAVLRRTYAAHRAGATQRAEAVAGVLGTLGTGFLAEAGAPAWVATAAHRAGVTLPVAAELQRITQLRLVLEAIPSTVREWAQWLLDALAEFSAVTLDAAINPTAWTTTAAQGIHGDGAASAAAWGALGRTMTSWLDGDPLTHVGAALEGVDPPISTSRASGQPLPRLLRAIREGFEFDLASIAGALVAVIATGAEEDGPDTVWDLPPTAQHALATLPLAVRLGVADPAALALIRAGARPRVLAQLLAGRLPVTEGYDDDDLRRWAGFVVDDLDDDGFLDQVAQSDTERDLFRAAAHVRAML